MKNINVEYTGFGYLITTIDEDNVENSCFLTEKEVDCLFERIEERKNANKCKPTSI